MNTITDQEILVSLKNWKEIISKYQKPDTKKAIIQIINSFGPFFMVWFLMYFSLSWSYWLTLGLAFVNAFFLVRIFIIQHDCGHQSFLKSKKWNNSIGWLCSFFSSIPFKYWAKIHNHHHGHNGLLEIKHRDIGDIKFLTVEEYSKLSAWKKFNYRIFRMPVILFGIVPFVYLTISNRYPFLNLKGWTKVKRAQFINNILLVGLYLSLCLILGWKQFLMIQLPIIFIFSIIAFWFFYVQHQHEETYKEWQSNWDFLIASLRGATYYKLPKLFQWLTGNIGFHHIHHLSSVIPNYKLEKCFTENPILNKYVTTITFSESLRCIHNKLWDQKTQKMISFKEYRLLYKAS